MRKKGDALSKAWEAINTPLVAADSAMKDQADEEQKERKSLLLAIKRNSRERQARHIAKGMPIKSAQSKENTMSRTRGQSKTHTTGSIAREKQATHAHISKLMDDLPKDKPSKGITVTKKTVSMKPVSKTKPVTLCGLKKKAETMNITPKQRIKLAQALLKQAEKRAGIFGSDDGRLGPSYDMFGRNKWDRAGKPTPGKGNLPGGGPTRKGGMGSLLAQLALVLGGGVVGGKMGGKGVANLVRKFGPKIPKGAPHPATGALLPLAAGGVVGGGLAGGGAGYGLSEALKQGSDKQAKKRFMLKVAASNLSPREKLAMAGLVGRGLAAGAKALPGLMRGAGQAVTGAGRVAGKGLEAAGRGVGTLGGVARKVLPSPLSKAMGAGVRGAGKAMQAGGRAMQSAPGVAGGAGLAGIAAGRMSKGQPQQAGGHTFQSPTYNLFNSDLSKLPGDLNSSMSEMQKSMGGLSPAGTGLTGQPQAGGRGLHNAFRSMFGGRPRGGPQDAYQGQSPYGTGLTGQPVKQQSRSDF
tara:strand:+ start:9103 stop:10674 length:1572 start_codon:yes stop_codon:yes gene_type:complete